MCIYMRRSSTAHSASCEGWHVHVYLYAQVEHCTFRLHIHVCMCVCICAGRARHIPPPVKDGIGHGRRTSVALKHACMCACVSICASSYVFASACAYVHACMHACMHVHVHAHGCACTHALARRHACMRMGVHARMQAYGAPPPRGSQTAHVARTCSSPLPDLSYRATSLCGRMYACVHACALLARVYRV